LGAAEAKKKALDQLRSKPPLDEKIVAERQAARLKREAVKLERRAARQASEQAAREAVPQPPSEAQRKLERDARYAARKNRK